jgi:Domain of unknown function (DUF1735).
MRYFKYLYTIAIVLPAMLIVQSCVKDNTVTETNEKTLVKMPQAENEITTLALDATPGQIKVGIVEIRRDTRSPSELNKTQIVKVAPNPGLISAYNTAHGTNYIALTGFTNTPDNPFDGQHWTITFNPGEFAKSIMIQFDPTALDLSRQYALGFKIDQADGAFISEAKKEALIEVAIKNKYHGTYHASGIFHHPTAGDRVIDEDKNLLTTGGNSVRANLGDLGGSGYQMILTVNPANNSVTITPAGVTPNIDQHWGPNYYDPATKTYHLHYSYNTAAPRIIEETITKL